MAWAVDQLSIGNSGSGSSQNFTTNAVVAAGAWTFCAIGYFHASATVTGVSDNGPGLSWEFPAGWTHRNNNVFVALARAFAPAGMASGTVITYTTSVAPSNQWIAGASFSGSNAASAAGSPVTAAGTGAAAHAVSPITPSDDALALEVLHVNNTTANTPDANSIENVDYSTGGSAQRGVMQHRICAGAGAYTLGGTVGAVFWTAVGVGFTPILVPGPPPDGQYRYSRLRGARF